MSPRLNSWLEREREPGFSSSGKTIGSVCGQVRSSQISPQQNCRVFTRELLVRVTWFADLRHVTWLVTWPCPGFSGHGLLFYTDGLKRGKEAPQGRLQIKCQQYDRAVKASSRWTRLTNQQGALSSRDVTWSVRRMAHRSTNFNLSQNLFSAEYITYSFMILFKFTIYLWVLILMKMILKLAESALLQVPFVSLKPNWTFKLRRYKPSLRPWAAVGS